MRILRVLTIACLAFCARGQGVQSQSRSWRELSSGLREKTLDTAFPVDGVCDTQNRATLVLFFSPSFSPESQVVLCFAAKADIIAEYRRARFSARTAYRTSEPPQDASTIAAAMSVERVRFTLPAQRGKSWLRDFWASLAQTSADFKIAAPSDLVQLDGTKYRCEYREGLRMRLIVSLQSSELGHADPRDPPIVQWMQNVSRDLQSLMKAPER